MKLFAAGSDLHRQPVGVEKIIGLSDKSHPRVLLLGTAAYDDPGLERWNATEYLSRGCSVVSLPTVHQTPTAQKIRASFEDADVILLPGGNTLYAHDRLRKLGVDIFLMKAAQRGVVVAGGSAGAILLFNGGHSDSMNPATFREVRDTADAFQSETSWSYIRAPGLGILPGLVCPHFDSWASNCNGRLRSEDFCEMHERSHAGEHGIGIENSAALIVDGDTYHVMNTRSGPGVWKLEVNDAGGVIREALPANGLVAEVLKSAGWVAQDDRLDEARRLNPDIFEEDA